MQFHIQKFETTVSTNDDAKAAAEQGMPEGTVIWALQQSAGKGRHGRVWQSPIGNLYFSVILRPQKPQRDWGWYSFIASLAIGDAVTEILPAAKTTLKWPNDVLVDDKKISGILLEATDNALILGIGLNVTNTPDNPLYPATSIGEHTSNPPSLENILDKILQAIDRWCHIVDTNIIRTAWLSRARRGSMRVRLPSGDIHGEFDDIDRNGNLQLRRTDGKTTIISAGDVFF